MQIVLLFFPDLGKLFDMCQILSFFLFFLIKRWKIPENRKIDRKKRMMMQKPVVLLGLYLGIQSFPPKKLLKNAWKWKFRYEITVWKNT